MPKVTQLSNIRVKIQTQDSKVNATLSVVFSIKKKKKTATPSLLQCKTPRVHNQYQFHLISGRKLVESKMGGRIVQGVAGRKK